MPRKRSNKEMGQSSGRILEVEEETSRVEVAESLEVRTDNNEDKADNNLPEAQLPPMKPTFMEPKPRENKRRRQPDEVELKMIKALEERSPHISFIQGLLPHLHKFDDNEIL
ncbi:hypothetical protein J6590_051192 [Homalodisca vitripennis]|nr:hypothetical protein J6590_051192 [Homalodisca vitripennis]